MFRTTSLPVGELKRYTVSNTYLSGTEKAAIILLTLGEDLSGKLLKQLEPIDAQRILKSLSQLGRVSNKIQNDVTNEFFDLLQKAHRQGSIKGDHSVAQSHLIKAFPNEAWVDDFCSSLSSLPDELRAFRLLEARQMAKLLVQEHPQTIALALHFSHPKYASQVIRQVPENLKVEILIRMANIREIDPQLVEEIDDSLCQQIQGVTSRQQAIGGKEKVAAILSVMGTKKDEILHDIEEKDSELGEELQNLMFVFNDIAHLDSVTIREIFTSSPHELWPVALRGTSDQLKDAIFSVLSKRQKEMLKEDIESIGPKPLKDVEKAQKDILDIARKLEANGKISLEKDANDLVV